jgi:hypothetical protein
MVLGESTNSGWHATTGTGTDLGAPQLVDGYANGWLVTPTSPGHDMVVNLEWTPQRWVGAALVVSATALVVCLVLACWPRRMRRRPAADDDTLAVGSPLSSPGARPGWRGLVVVPLVAGAVAAAVLLPAAAVPVAALTLVALSWRHGRILIAAACVGLLAAVDATVAVSQAQHHFAAEFGWPAHFETAGRLAWLAVALLVADVLVEAARSRGARARVAPPTNSGAREGGTTRGRHVRRT